MSAIRFRAGRVLYDAEKKLATPEQIQGQITIKQSEEDDSFYSFQWAPKDNAPNVEKEDLLVIPGDVTWKQVTECKTGRVFALTFLSSGARHLFWLQEVSDDDDDLSALSKKDEEILEKIEKTFEPVEQEEEEQDVEIPDTETAPAATTAAASSETTLQNSQPIYDLNDVLTPQNLESLIDYADEETLQNLYAHLPESFEKTKENLRSVLLSGFFKRSASNLGSALNNGGGFVVSKSLNYDYEGEGIASFLNAIRKQTKKEEEDRK